MSSAQRRAELAARTEKARNMLAHNSIVPYGGNIQSETDAVILQQQGYRRVADKAELQDELEKETGRELNLLAYYQDIETIYEAILPGGVYSEQWLAHVTGGSASTAADANVAVASALYNLNAVAKVRAAAFAAAEKAAADPTSVAAAVTAAGVAADAVSGGVAAGAATAVTAAANAAAAANDAGAAAAAAEVQLQTVVRTLTSTPAPAAAYAVDTPDKAVKLAGSIKLDERVQVQLSIAAALVINKILQSVPSHEVVDQGSAFSTKTVIYFEDLVVYIQRKFGDVISLDFDNDYDGDFSSLSDDEVRRFARKLLKKLVLTPAAAENTFASHAEMMVPVKAASVGKVWESKGFAMSAKVSSDAIMVGTEKILVEGNAGIAFGTKFKVDIASSGTTIQNTLNNAVCVVLGSVALHVISYALAYGVDAYIRLAIHGADRDNNTITFNAEGAGDAANVITPQMIYPGIKSALDMYGVHLTEWDNKVAFYLRANSHVLNIFMHAKKLYDIDTTKPAVKGFMNAKMLDPMWMTSREDKAKLQDLYSKVKGRRNGTSAAPTPAYTGLNQASADVIRANDFDALSESIVKSQKLGMSASFGRRRKRRSASFGKKKHGKRRSASFGKKKHGKRRSASFGKKTRRVRK
jgi:hypothetical protein